MPLTRRSLFALLGLVTCLPLAAVRSQATPQHSDDEPQVRAYPLQRVGEQSVVWLEVTGPGAERVDPGVDAASLLAGGKELRPLATQIRRPAGRDELVLDGRRVRRIPGAAYMRFAFPPVTAKGGQVELSWIWHEREAGQPLSWRVPSLGETPRSLGMRTGEGLTVSVPAAGWQDDGPVRLVGTGLAGAADRAAWFHLVVRPSAEQRPRLPAHYVGYELRFRRDGLSAALPIATKRASTLGGRVDEQHLLAQFDLKSGAGGTLEWTPVFSRSMDREYLLEVPAE